MGRSDHAVFELAGRQHGLVSLAQLRALGCTRARLRRLVATGALVAVAPRVYGRPGAHQTFDRQLAIGVLGLGPGAVVSHLAAARLHGLVATATPAFTVPRARRNAVCAFELHATDALAATEQVVIDGLPCTSVARTVLDLAATDLPTGQLRAIIDASGGATGELRRALQQRRGRGTAGVSRLDAVLIDPRTIDERRFLAELARHGLPRPTRLHGEARPTYRFDGYGVTVALTPTACDWPAIARVTRHALCDAGWPQQRAAAVA